LREIPGTEKAQSFGDPGEEYLVEVDQDILSATGMTARALAEQIESRLTRQPAGLLRLDKSELPLNLSQEIGSANDLGEILVQVRRGEPPVALEDIAEVRRDVTDPPDTLAYLSGKRSIAVGLLLENNSRIDRWSKRLVQTVTEFQKDLPGEIEVELTFSQADFVEARLQTLLQNLLLGTVAVALVVFVMMGWRSTIVITSALPLSAVMVLIGLRAMHIPIHQMSVTGLIIALGLLIDNAIVIVDDVRSRIRGGLRPARAIEEGVRHLAMPLFGSTLTTTLAFLPIATLSGPSGEFVGTIAVSVILAINASFLLAMTVVPAMTAHFNPGSNEETSFQYGLRIEWLKQLYLWSLGVLLKRPLAGVMLGVALPLMGFYLAARLPEQFFPPTDREQIHVEIELAARSSLDETAQVARRVRESILQEERVDEVHLFVGGSAPTFFYNVVPRRRGTPFYAQAIVELKPGTSPQQLVRSLQRKVIEDFPDQRILVRQLEQGPPFDAPIEIRVDGPEFDTLQSVGEELRLLLSETRDVIHTRSDLEEVVPQLKLEFDDRELSAIGYRRDQVAGIVYSALEGSPAGAILEGPVEVPVVVRLKDRGEVRLEQLEALELHPIRGLQGRPPQALGPLNSSAETTASPEGGTPLAAIAQFQLSSDVAAITRINGRRVNEVKAYITAGVLPSVVLREWEQRLEAANIKLPDQYEVEYGGESAERDEAVQLLMTNAVVLFALMLLAITISFRSFRATFVIVSVGGLAIGLGPAALWCFGFPLGFMAIVGTMGLVGVAINDAIVVMAGLRAEESARQGDADCIRDVVLHATRHVLTTTLTTIAGFLPLILAGGRFWPPLAITIAGGVGGATLLALYFVPTSYRILQGKPPEPAVAK
jgi:multidrug efflux pump subunit AcrB